MHSAHLNYLLACNQVSMSFCILYVCMLYHWAGLLAVVGRGIQAHSLSYYIAQCSWPHCPAIPCSAVLLSLAVAGPAGILKLSAPCCALIDIARSASTWTSRDSGASAWPPGTVLYY